MIHLFATSITSVTTKAADRNLQPPSHTMHFQLGALFSLVAALASVRGVPAPLDERQQCAEGDGTHRYVMLRPGEYTFVTALDKLGSDNWSIWGGAGVVKGPWYFDPSPEPPARPYTVEHLAVTTFREVKDVTWDEVWNRPDLLHVDGVFEVSMSLRRSLYPSEGYTDAQCRVEAKYGISPPCVSVSLNPLWKAGNVISPSQADVITSCTQIA